jgi:hypothetical protein
MQHFYPVRLSRFTITNDVLAILSYVQEIKLVFIHHFLISLCMVFSSPQQACLFAGAKVDGTGFRLEDGILADFTMGATNMAEVRAPAFSCDNFVYSEPRQP